MYSFQSFWAVELRNEQTDTVKDEILKVASKLLKPGNASGETTSNALDIYGIQAALNSKAGRYTLGVYSSVDYNLQTWCIYGYLYIVLYNTVFSASVYVRVYLT